MAEKTTRRCKRLLLLSIAGTCLLQPGAHAQTRILDTWHGYDVGSYATGRFNISIAVGDIDGDGDVDFVASKQDLQRFNFAVVKNRGDGTYGPHVLVSTSGVSGDIALADVDVDGDLDVVLADIGTYGAGNTMSVFKNDGQGAFGARQAFPAGPSPTSLAAADFDHDGDLDVAVTNHGFWNEGTTLNLLSNDGTGSFGMGASFEVGAAPRKVLAVDVNADGWADLAIANDRTATEGARVTILMNDLIGGFAPAVSYDARAFKGYAGDLGACIAAGDMDNDGDVDLVFSSSKIYVDGILPVGGYFLFANNGNGTYAPKQYKSLGVDYSQGVIDLEVADLDENGWNDVVGAQFSDTAESAYYVQRRGDAGEYPAAAAYKGGQGVYDIAIADANGDGKPDIFCDNYYSYSVSVHENLGSGIFAAAPRFDTSPLDHQMDAGDIDGDGDLDVVTAGGYGTDGSVAVLRNNGNATFSAPEIAYQQYLPGGIKLRDLNGDGRLDMVWGDFNAPNAVPLHVHYNLNDGTGHFGVSITVPMSMGDINDVNAVDLDGDGRLDILASDSLRDEIKVARNLGNGTFSAAVAFAGPSGATQMVFGDFDLDGKLDAAVAGPGVYGYSHELGVLLGNGDGTFQPVAIYDVDDGPYTIATGDFDGDGVLDLATANGGFENDPQPSISVLIGNGDGTLRPEVRYLNSAIQSPSQMAAVDADGDGDSDLLIANYSSNDLSILRNRGNGTFEQHVRHGVDTRFQDFRYADFDGDGTADIAGLCMPPLPIVRGVISIVKGLPPPQAPEAIFRDGFESGDTANWEP